MKVILRQSGRSCINLCIETSDICTIIHISVTFDPYERLYIWLGQIRDSQLPASMIIIDEEGYMVELIAEPNENDTVFFHVESWASRVEWITCGKEMLNRRELIKAFHDGIVEFINNEFIPSNWSYIDDLSYQNWNALVTRDADSQNWDRRLLMIRNWRTFSDTDTLGEEHEFTLNEESLMVLRSLFQAISMIGRGNFDHIRDLVNLYRTLPIDIALDEVDRNWYLEKRIEIDIERGSVFGHDSEKIERRRDLQKIRLRSLKVGQVIDGTVVGIKSYGLFVNIGGIAALLHNSEISHMPIEDLHQVFQQNDWVRSIIIWMDIEKGRVSLSTKILEPEAGDMLKEPWKVYEKAEEMAARYHEHVLSKITEVD
jgi:predicted RNA-binding protein with RPS1 domain